MQTIQRVVSLIGIVILLLISSQVGAGEKEWEGVRVTDDDSKVADCTLIGEVKGKSGYGGLLAQNVGEEKAYKHIKRNAWEMGGNTVLLLTGRSGFGGAKYRGEAYRCDSGEMAPEDTIVLGGIEICGPEKSSLDYLGAVPEPDQDENDLKARYAFDLPIPLAFGGLEPNFGFLTTRDGRVDEVVVGWQEISKLQQDAIWSELYGAFVSSKGNPGFEKESSYAKWREAGGRKETWIARSDEDGSIRIAVICREKLTHQEKNNAVDSAF